MTTQFHWAVDKLEKGEEVSCLFEAKLLESIRLYLEKEYQSWPVEIKVKDSMMTLTPKEIFVRRENPNPSKSRGLKREI